jgi:hypothetical protein
MNPTTPEENYKLWLSGSCPHCLLKFPTPGDRNRHLLNTQKHILPKFPCAACPHNYLMFDTYAARIAHFHHFHLEKPVLKCIYKDCSNTYWNERTLRLHEQRGPHSSATRFCDLCAKTLPTRRGFCTHQRKIHGVKQARTVACHVCARIFSKISDLHIHEVIVHEKNRWQCLTCGQCNSSRIALEEHWAYCQHSPVEKKVP